MSETTLDLSEDANAATPAASPESRDRLRYFGDYELIDEIARGGMGVVYRARQVSLNRIVAVKMILSGRLASETEVKRFRVEAEAAANLQHPHIVAIHEIGEHSGRHYFSMDFIAGKNLAEHVAARSEPLSTHEIARLIGNLAEAVHYAHQRGTLHRDLKPQNVLIDAQGRPHITDFGLAKRWEAPAATAATGTSGSTSATPAESGASGSSELTRTGAIIGSPSYMAPEQAAGRVAEIGPATDVYALGAILYQLLTGQPPHRGISATDTLLRVLNEEPAAPSAVKANVPADLETICLKCLEKQPERRYASARLLAEELERFLGGMPIFARRASPWRKTWSWALRHPWVITGAISSIVMGLVFVTFLLWEKTRFLTWRLSHTGPSPYDLWPNLLFRELNFPTAIIAYVAIFASVGCYGDVTRRRAAGRTPSGRRFAVYFVLNLGCLAIWCYFAAKVIRTCVWAEAPPGIAIPILVLLQLVLWQGLQFFWPIVRSLRASQSGVELPPDFLTMPEHQRARPNAPFSLGFNRQILRERFRELRDQEGEIRTGRPFFALFGSLVGCALLFGGADKIAWFTGAVAAVIFIHCVAGLINPRWVMNPASRMKASPGGMRLYYSLGGVGTGAFCVLLHNIGMEPPAIAGFYTGLLAGIAAVVWRIWFPTPSKETAPK